MNKRKCVNCGIVHEHMPYTDCYKSENNEVPFSLEEHYNNLGFNEEV